MSGTYPRHNPAVGDSPPSLQVANNCSVCLTAAKVEIINTYDRELIMLVGDTSMHDSQQCVVAHRNHQTIGKGRSGPASRRQTKMVDDHLEPLRAPSITSQNAVIELFAEDAPPAQNCITPESASQDRQLYTPTTKQKVGG
jgi:hypothetical protein